MIKVNKNGWLHRFNKATSSLSDSYWDNMTNFCEYFWRTVLRFVILSGFLSVICAALTGVGGILLGHNDVSTFDWWTWFAAPALGASSLAALAGVAFGGGWAFYELRGIYHDHRTSTYETRAEKKRRKKERRDSNWIVVMYRSKKEKYCPSVKIE